MSYQASRKADSVLNHSLKNRMADAAGEVELFLETYTGPHAVLLECVASLRRGMQLCQHRQAYVDLAAGRYAPRLTPSSVHEFGSALAAGRKLLLREFCRVRAAFDTGFHRQNYEAHGKGGADDEDQQREELEEQGRSPGLGLQTMRTWRAPCS